MDAGRAARRLPLPSASARPPARRRSPRCAKPGKDVRLMIRIPRIAGRAAILSLGLYAMLQVTSPPFGGDARAAAQEAPALRGIELEVKEGKVSGSFTEQPLNAVLKALIGDPDFVPDIPVALADYPVSARLDSVPLKEAFERILAPFDHVLVLGPDGESPAAIVVIGLRNRGNPTTQADDIAAPQEEDAAAKRDVVSDETPVGPPGSEPETGIVFMADESLDGPRATDGISDEELINQTQGMDLEMLAAEAGLPVEALYMGTPEDGEEPQINPNALRSLLDSRGQ